jgi:hypothetical protein
MARRWHSSTSQSNWVQNATVIAVIVNGSHTTLTSLFNEPASCADGAVHGPLPNLSWKFRSCRIVLYSTYSTVHLGVGHLLHALDAFPRS